MNSLSILWRARGATWLAVAGMLAAGVCACGNESVNVLALRDAGGDAGADDVSLDLGPDDVTLDPSPNDLSLDTGPSDLTLDTGPTDATGDARADMPGFTDGPPTTGCLAEGAGCSFAGQCCSLSCPLPSIPNADRVCAAGPLCAGAGDACTSNADCCANRCQGGFCEALPPTSCLPAGEPCAANGDCCGARCTAIRGGPTTRCWRLGGCRVLGEVCVTQYDCCSGRCDVDGPNGRVRVCLAAPECNLAGGVCRGQAGDRCNTDADCCTDGCAAGADSVLRCFSTAACGGECALCAPQADCCPGRRCIGDESGYQRCEAARF